MATKPSTVPGWGPVGTTPTTPQKAAGFATNGPLPAGWLNWFWTLVSTWIAYLRDGVIVGEAGAPGLTVTGGSGAGGKGMVVTAGGTNENGIESTGTGTGAGLKGIGGASGNGVEGTSASIAVKGTASGNGKGGEFTSAGNGDGAAFNASGAGSCVAANHTGTGSAVLANAGAGSGYGITCSGNATSAPLRLTPQAQPSTGALGDFYFSSVDQKVRVCTTAGTPGTWTVVGTQT